MAVKTSAAKTKATAKKTVRKSATKRVRSKSQVQVRSYLPLYYQLNDLWHTVKHISLLEETVCTLREEARTAEEMDPEFVRDLRRLLDQLPSRELTSIVDGLRPTVSRARERKSPASISA